MWNARYPGRCVRVSTGPLPASEWDRPRLTAFGRVARRSGLLAAVERPTLAGSALKSDPFKTLDHHNFSLSVVSSIA